MLTMKRETSLIICCSLAVAGALFAQQPDEQPSPTNKGHQEHGGKKSQATNESQESATPKTAHPGHEKGAGAQQNQDQGQPTATQEGHPNHAAHGVHNKANAETNATSKTEGEKANANSTNGANAEASATPRVGKAARDARRTNRNANASPSASPAASASTATAGAAASATPATTPNTATQTNQQNTATATTNTGVAGGAATGPNGRARRVDQQKVTQVKQQVQTIKQRNASFKAQPRPDKAPAVTFNQSYRIQGAEHWQGPQYEVFRSYHPERHDQGWYHQHYTRVELIGGGYYYWNNNYWYPAWGYDTGHEYYAYDGPIYTGRAVRPPDQVIADVQTELQEMGYYTGEVDGLLGPLTREALTAYQEDENLAATAAIDEPTLDSLGMES